MRNLLKYDFKYVWRVWWIAALATLCATAIGILSTNRMITTDDYVVPEYIGKSVEGVLDVLSVSGVVIFIVALFVFLFLTELLILYRFYKNLYTDEGYLTFTLPKTENSILMSKSISGSVSMLVTYIVVIAFLATFVISLMLGELGLKTTCEFFSEAIQAIFEELGPYAVIYITEAIVAFLIGIIFNLQIGYLSITIGSIIAKKNKLLAAIGIYFLITTAFSIISELFGTLGLINALEMELYDQMDLLIAIGFGILILFLAGIAVGAYFLNLHFMKKKLNLA